MAETFNRSALELPASLTNAYVAPNNASTDRAIVLSVLVANVDGSNAATLRAQVFDAGGNSLSHLAYDIAVPAGASLELISNKLVLLNGDVLKLQAGAASDLEAVVSVLEIT
jgi:hypothetical protein